MENDTAAFPQRVELTDEEVIKKEHFQCRLFLRIIAGDSWGCSVFAQLETVATGNTHLISLHLSKTLSASNQLGRGQFYSSAKHSRDLQLL